MTTWTSTSSGSGGARGCCSAGLAGSSFDASAVQNRADTAWRWAGLERITLHEARHTFASLMIAAGVNSKVLSTVMGHASVAITLDRYAKLFEEQEREAAGLLDAYLTRADTGSRLVQAGLWGEHSLHAAHGAMVWTYGGTSCGTSKVVHLNCTISLLPAICAFLTPQGGDTD